MDRDRLYALYLEKALADIAQPLSFLDIAPSPPLAQWLRRQKNVEYRSCDLYIDGVDDQVDIMEMPYESGSFDVVLCSHVLEHVDDDKKAVKELFRVLRKGGWGIVMVPICLSLVRTDADPRLEAVEERWRRFGQDDHVRLYARGDFMALLEGAGFSVEQHNIASFPNYTFHKHAIDPKSVLYTVHKQYTLTTSNPSSDLHHAY